MLKQLSDDEIEQLTLEIANVRKVDARTQLDVLREFGEACLAQNYILGGGIEYARDILNRAIGQQRACELISKLTSSLQVRPFDFARRMDAILVAMPIHACRYVVWPAGTHLEVSMIEPGRGIWRFQACVLDNGLVGQGLERIRTCTLVARSGLVRFQRRSHFRVECRVDVTLRGIAAAESACSPDDEAGRAVEGITQNLSAGGASVLTIDPPPESGMVELTLTLPLAGEGRFRTRCRTIRCEPVNQPGQRKYRLALQFANLSNADQGMLVRCLQRLQIRQGSEPDHS